jgi:hypothetical protein
MNFECHITCDVKDAEKVKGYKGGWTFSQIDGDPAIPGLNCFLTTHDSDWERIYMRMVNAVAWLHDSGIKIKRQKIKLIVHDQRYE